MAARRLVVFLVLFVIIRNGEAGMADFGSGWHIFDDDFNILSWAGEIVTASRMAMMDMIGSLFNERSKVETGPQWHYKPIDKHPCNRPCKKGEAMTCYYKFSVEWYYAMSKACYDCPDTLQDCYREDCIAVDGVKRTVMVVNRQLPGPAIEVCLGDKLIVDLENKMNDESTSIHWHGHHQVQSPYMDGVPFITQCPVSPNTVFRYTMDVTNRGTHFWHAHTGVQRGDGVFGPLIVRVPESWNPLVNGERMYDEDLSEHVIVANDWTHVTDMEKLQWHLQSSGNNKPDTILVNGRGRFYNGTVRLTNTPLAVFTVKKGVRYRFRVINSGVHNCPLEMSIDQHHMTAVASDGYLFDPVKVDSLVSYAGERWDFVLEADQEMSNYWIRFTGLMDCDERFNSAHQVAVLHYEGAPEVEPRKSVGYRAHSSKTLQLNTVNAQFNQPGTISIPKLCASDKHKDRELLRQKPDMSIYLAFDFNGVDNPMYHKPNAYGFNEVEEKYRRYTPQFNHVTFKMPHAPLLTQFNDSDPSLFCDNMDLSNCRKEFCECIYIIDIPLGSRTELILIDKGVTFDANHPFHLHGYGFRVIGMDRLGKSTDLDQVMKMYTEGKLIHNLIDPPCKDTVTVPDGGYTILRFHATNPGFWLLHCHIEFHLEAGMAVVFRIGKPDDLPPKPRGFPTCGNFLN